MAQVSVSVGGIQLGFEDEDHSAKSLSKLALETLASVVDMVGTPVEEEEVDGER